jgi:hypothetical protein
VGSCCAGVSPPDLSPDIALGLKELPYGSRMSLICAASIAGRRALVLRSQRRPTEVPSVKACIVAKPHHRPFNTERRNPFHLVRFLIVVSKDVFVPEMAPASDAAKMRQRASRLLDLAKRSRCEGRPDYASLLTDVATEILEHARNIEQRNESRNISPSVGHWSGTSKPDAA